MGACDCIITKVILLQFWILIVFASFEVFCLFLILLLFCYLAHRLDQVPSLKP